MVVRSERGIAVLAIDDDQDILDLTSSWLSRNPCFEVSTAASGDEGWNLIQTGAFDVVVSDYQMPGMDGLELLKTIRASSNSIPFILFTGKGRESIVINPRMNPRACRSSFMRNLPQDGRP